MSDLGPIVRLAPASIDCATGLVTVLLHHTTSVATLTMPTSMTIPFQVRLPNLGPAPAMP